MKTNIIIINIILLFVACETELEYCLSCGEDVAWDLENCWECGEVWTDLRDGQTYQTKEYVVEGNQKQCWMIENMRYGECIEPGSKVENGKIQHYCPTNCSSSPHCETEGLYKWDVAMNYQRSGIQGICPEGWHIPSKIEFEQLYKSLVSNLMYVWGEDGLQFGQQFYIQPNGIHIEDSIHFIKNNDNYQRTALWSRTDDGDTVFILACGHFGGPTPYIELINIDENDRVRYEKDFGLCVRCIKDN